MEGVFTEVPNWFFNNREGSFNILKGMGSLKELFIVEEVVCQRFLYSLEGNGKNKKPGWFLLMGDPTLFFDN